MVEDVSIPPDLLAAYMKMESVEFYAELLYKAKMLGGPKEFDQATVQKLYEIRRKMGLSGKHPADLCLNKNGKTDREYLLHLLEGNA